MFIYTILHERLDTVVSPRLNRLSRRGLPLLAAAALLTGAFVTSAQAASAGNLVTTLTASSAGTVSYTLSPSALGLSAGRHVLTLQSMLITPTAIFTSR